MKKFFAYIILILFMAGAIYLLLNEGRFTKFSRTKVSKKNLVISRSKKIGEKKHPDFTPLELQRMRIDSESTFRFENAKTSESYELDEQEMEEFTRKLNSINSINHIQENNLPPSDVSEEREKEYYTE